MLLFRVPTCAVSKINFTRDRQKPTLRARSLCYLISYSVNVTGNWGAVDEALQQRMVGRSISILHWRGLALAECLIQALRPCDLPCERPMESHRIFLVPVKIL